jgi:hypothetical protein
MSIETSKYNPTELQAFVMAIQAKITLTPEQIKWYVEHRLGIFKHKSPEEPSIPLDLSDQRLLDKLLTPEQRFIFRSHFPNIFPYGSEPED